jgi:hypothetical protein
MSSGSLASLRGEKRRIQMIDEYTGKKIVSPLDFRMISDDVLCALSDDDFNLLWGVDRRLKPLSELPQHIQDIPGIKELFPDD